MTELSQFQKDFVSYSGMVGLGLAIGCFFQQLYIIKENSAFMLLSLSALAGIVAFIFLLRQRREAGVLLIIASVLLFVRQGFIAWMARNGVIMFSLLQLIFIIYCIVITIMVILNGYPALFKKIAAEKKADENYWKNTMS